MGSEPFDDGRESSAALVRLFDACCVLDAWRYLHHSSSWFTWLSGDGSVSSRIDFVGCPFAWVASVSSCDMVSCPFRITVLFCFVCLFLMLSLLALVCGS